MLLIFSVAVIIPTITLTIRRLNALGKPMPLGFISAIPILGYGLFGYLVMLKDPEDSGESDEYVPIEGFSETTIDELADVATVSPKFKESKSFGEILESIGKKFGFIRKDGIGDAKIIADEGTAINISKGSDFKTPVVKEVKNGLGYRLITKKEKIWLKELRYTSAEQDAFAKNRLHFTLLALVIAIAGLIFGGQAAGGIFGIGIGFGIFMMWERRGRLKREYNQYNFEKQVEFSKFMRIVVPYLMNQSNYSFYEVLSKIVEKMRIEAEFKPISASAEFASAEDLAKIKEAAEVEQNKQRLFDLERVDEEPIPIESVEEVDVILPKINLQEKDII